MLGLVEGRYVVIFENLVGFGIVSCEGVDDVWLVVIEEVFIEALGRAKLVAGL